MRYGYSIDAGQFTSPSGKETTVTLVTVRHVSEKIIGGSLLRGAFDDRGTFTSFVGAEPIDEALSAPMAYMENWLSFMNGEWSGYQPEYPDPIGLRQKAAGDKRHVKVVALDWRSLAAYLTLLGYTPTATADRHLVKEMSRREADLARGEEVYTPPKQIIVEEGDLLPV